MPTKTIFLAQAFHWIDGRLEPGRHYQFSRSEAAVAAGKALAPSVNGVAVVSLEGDPQTDLWEDPHIIARFGVTPRHAA